MTGDNQNFPIDLVYLWVDGNDSEWRKKRNAFCNIPHSDEGMDCEGRYCDNDELRFSLRSAEMYAPWLRKIFIVTDNQVPSWLDSSNPKIRVVDHKEILPAEVLPTFNSTVIEHALFRIPDLSEHFLYANDDMFFNRPVRPEDFFDKSGLPIIRLSRRMFRHLSFLWKELILKRPLSNYNLTIQNSARLVQREYGKYIGHKTHHNIDAYRKSFYRHAYETFRKDIEPTLCNHIRSDNDIQRNIYSFVPIVEGKAKVKFVGKHTSFRFHIEKLHYYRKLEKCNPMLFCMNDSEYADENARKTLEVFLNKRFPEKSQFEK